MLGHKSRQTPTDHYVHVDPDTIREAICAYEAHLLAADPTHTDRDEAGVADSPDLGVEQ